MDKNYNMPEYNANDEDMWRMFQTVKTIAVVGLSRSQKADSYRVATYLREHGYRIIPVKPKAKEILNEKVYATLEEIPEKIDVVNVFRPSKDIPGIVTAAIAIGAKVIWTQERIVHRLAATRAHEAGLQVVMNKCIMKEHKRYMIDMSL
jgi:predicted CoA-binding protein